MSTNCTITLKRKDGTKTSIYCHWDGYVERVGAILQLAYNTVDKIEKLLALGDLSSIGYYTDPNPNKEHSFDGKRQENVCVAYHRDRGEEFRQSGGHCQFNYTFNEQEQCWYVEEEKYKEDTKGIKLLDLNCTWTYSESLLIDAILGSDIENQWNDDEFATAENVKKVCVTKAIAARKEITEKQAEAYSDFYHAYYD